MGRPWLVIGAVAAALAVAGPAGAHARPHIRLATWQPPAVKGTGFHRHERVTVVVRQSRGAPLTRHARATGAGTFKVTFSSAVPPCGNFRVTATGSLGSRATLPGRRYPDCVIR
jgi:hypothetical protein